MTAIGFDPAGFVPTADVPLKGIKTKEALRTVGALNAWQHLQKYAVKMVPKHTQYI